MKKVTIFDFVPRNYDLTFGLESWKKFVCSTSSIPYFIGIDLVDFLDLFGVTISDDTKFCIIDTKSVRIKFQEVGNIVRVNLSFK